MSILIKARDIERARVLLHQAHELSHTGESLALKLKDWHLCHYSYLYEPHVLLLDQDKRIQIVMTEETLLQCFGHQIWIAFLNRMGRTSASDVVNRPRITGFTCEGRLGLPPDYLYGAQISEVINWLP
jgi:hypothetical protein